jgi:hypothetical protein
MRAIIAMRISDRLGYWMGEGQTLAMIVSFARGIEVVGERLD